MPSNPTTLLAPAIAAFPRYGELLNAIASLMASDVSAAPPIIPAGVSIRAGSFLSLDGGGAVAAFYFGDAAGASNALRGYNAAHLYDTPGAFTATMAAADGSAQSVSVTVAADVRPQVALTAGEDLAAALAHLTAPTIVLLAAGATYDVTAPITLDVNGLTLRAAGAGPAPRICRIGSPDNLSTLIIKGSDISLEGIEFDSDQLLKPTGNVKVGVNALDVHGNKLLVRDCVFRNVDDAIHCESDARDLLVVGCQFTNELRACGVYFSAMQDAVVLGVHAVGSVCEHIFRLEGATNVLIDGCDVNNSDGKETLTVRMGHCVAATGNIIRAWTRLSELPTYPSGTYCTDILIAANHYTGLRASGPWLQINPGCQTVWVDSNIFDADANQGCIGLQAPSTDLKFTANQISLTPGTKAAKPLVRPFGNPTFTESGTTMSPAPVPTPAAKAR